MATTSIVECTVRLKLDRPVTGMEIIEAVKKVTPHKNLHNLPAPDDSYVTLGRFHMSPIGDIVVIVAKGNQPPNAVAFDNLKVVPLASYGYVALSFKQLDQMHYSMTLSNPEEQFFAAILEYKRALEQELNQHS